MRARRLSLELLLVASTAIPAFSQSTERVSVASDGSEGNNSCQRATISGDGSRVAFDTYASNLVGGDTNGALDCFVRDRASATTTRVSTASSGAGGNGASYRPKISWDGLWIAFTSDATNLVSNDKNKKSDLFLKDFVGGTTTRVSVSSSGAEGDGTSQDASISSDGRYVAFWSDATNLVSNDHNGRADVFVRDTGGATTVRVSVDSSGIEGNNASYTPAISADGRYVAFESDATNLVSGDTNRVRDLFVHDLTTGATTRVSVDSNGVQGTGDSTAAAISADGRLVAFASSSTNFATGDTNGRADVFVHDTVAGTTILVSQSSSGVLGDDESDWPAFSGDGRWLAFDSFATNLVDGDVNHYEDAFVHDLSTGATYRESLSDSGGEGDNVSYWPTLSDDGSQVAFTSRADDLIAADGNAATDIFVRSRRNAAAAWSNYGNGFAGTLGVPGLTASAAPVLDRDVTIGLDDSAGVATVALLLIGTQATQIDLSWGAELLVVPLFTTLVSVPVSGLAMQGSIPADESLAGLTLYLQALESDRGASHGLSLTPGLELDLGY